MNLPDSSSAACEIVCQQIDDYLSGELTPEIIPEFLAHIEHCPACAAELEGRSRVRNSLREAIQREFVPPRLRVAVSDRLRRRRWFAGASRNWALAFACLALLVVAGIGGERWMSALRGRDTVAGILGLGVSDHLYCAIAGHNYPETANSPDELRYKLGSGYAPLVDIVESRLQGFEVLEAHVCSVPGSPRRYVHFIARRRTTILSVILTRRQGESLPGGAMVAAVAPGDVPLYSASLRNVQADGFEARDYFGFVVADLNADEVLDIASRLAPPIRQALDARAPHEATLLAYPSTLAELRLARQ